MAANTMTLIEILSGRDNYSTWKFAVQTYLQHEELWDCITNPNPVDLKKDLKAKSKLILLIDSVNYIHIQEAKTAHEIWNNLEKAFDDSGLTRRAETPTYSPALAPRGYRCVRAPGPHRLPRALRLRTRPAATLPRRNRAAAALRTPPLLWRGGK